MKKKNTNKTESPNTFVTKRTQKESNKKQSSYDKFERKMEGIIRLAGMFGLSGFMGYLGYLFYEKNNLLSFILILICIVLTIYVIYNEVEFKRKRHQEPWNFDVYRGE